MDVFGSDDELRSLHAFLGRPTAERHVGARPGGRGGDREVDALARRRRGARVSAGCASSLLGRPRSSWESLCRAGRSARGRARGRAVRARRLRGGARSRSPLLLRDDAGRAGGLPHACRGRPHGLQLLAARARSAWRSTTSSGWTRSSASALAFALRRLAGRGHPPPPRPHGSGRDRRCPSSSERSTKTGVERARRPAQRGRAARDPANAARQGVRAADALCACMTPSGGNPFFALALARAWLQTSIRRSRCRSRRRSRRSSALASPGCRTRRAKRCCSRPHTAAIKPCTA